MECYKQASAWTLNRKRPEIPFKDAFLLYEPSFNDNKDTVIIIDEIQESNEVYNCIREITRNFQSYFIVIGSYLGRVHEPGVRHSSGDVTKICIYPMSFEEVMETTDERLYVEYFALNDYKDNMPDVFERLKTVYDVYYRIGGYPAVVRKYIRSRSFQRCTTELRKIIDTFMDESMHYFTDILDISVFANILLAVCRILIREKKGLETSSISEELQKLVVKDNTGSISKSVYNRAVNWLYHSGIIKFCGKVVVLDILDFKPGRRCFFMDLGLAYYYLSLAGATDETLMGTLNENFVFIELCKRQDNPAEIIFEMPAFATFKGGEIDFIVQNFQGKRFAIEVKSGKHSGATAKKALEEGKVDCLLYLKGKTKGGIDGRVITMPVYMAEQVRFD